MRRRPARCARTGAAVDSVVSVALLTLRCSRPGAGQHHEIVCGPFFHRSLRNCGRSSIFRSRSLSWIPAYLKRWMPLKSRPRTRPQDGKNPVRNRYLIVRRRLSLYYRQIVSTFWRSQARLPCFSTLLRSRTYCRGLRQLPFLIHWRSAGRIHWARIRARSPTAAPAYVALRHRAFGVLDAAAVTSTAGRVQSFVCREHVHAPTTSRPTALVDATLRVLRPG